MNRSDPTSVLFVCMGNICRSPTGEAVMRHVVSDRGLDERIRVDSAGTISYHAGKRPDPRMREAGERRGYEFLSRARPIEPADLDRFDLVVAMDRENLEDIHALERHGVARERRRAEVRLLSEFLPDGSEIDVPDPYYGGARGFEHVLDMIESACPAIVDHLLERKS